MAWDSYIRKNQKPKKKKQVLRMSSVPPASTSTESEPSPTISRAPPIPPRPLEALPEAETLVITEDDPYAQ